MERHPPIRFSLAATLVAGALAWSSVALGQVPYEPEVDDGWIAAFCEAHRPDDVPARCFVRQRADWSACHDAHSFYRCTADLEPGDPLEACESRFCGPPVLASLPSWEDLELACDRATPDAPATGPCELAIWDRAYEHADPDTVVACLGSTTTRDEWAECWTAADTDTRTWLLDREIDHNRPVAAESDGEARHTRLARELVGFVKAFEGCATPGCHDDLAAELAAWRKVNRDHLGDAQFAIVDALVDGLSLRIRHDLEDMKTATAEHDPEAAPDPGLDARRYEPGFAGCTALDPVVGHAATVFCDASQAAAACGDGDPRTLLIADLRVARCPQRLQEVWSGVAVGTLSHADEARIATLCARIEPTLQPAPGALVCQALLRARLWQGDDLSCVEEATDQHGVWRCVDREPTDDER